MNVLKVAISPCPNDIFIFAPLMNGFVPSPFIFDFTLDDVEQLNIYAMEKKFDLIKVSYGALEKIVDNYKILTCGGALGHKNGPIVVSKNYSDVSCLVGKRIAIPGKNTSAFMMFKSFFGDGFVFCEMRFDRIFEALLNDEVDAGVIIHEGRFIYFRLGLKLVCDLGEMWEERYKIPIPLGAIALKNVYIDIKEVIKDLIKSSIKYSFTNFDEIRTICKGYAQELDDQVLTDHIKYFVNEYSLDMSSISDKVADTLNLKKDIFI
ncbi:MAG: 1,4-dihydroxy-6-naphthoate synthase [Calditerrivibrio sp.]|nr:1,4-dihydroxy-6-naphthoate synthase [Calditerrivibrio sp.]